MPSRRQAHNNELASLSTALLCSALLCYYLILTHDAMLSRYRRFGPGLGLSIRKDWRLGRVVHGWMGYLCFLFKLLSRRSVAIRFQCLIQYSSLYSTTCYLLRAPSCLYCISALPYIVGAWRSYSNVHLLISYPSLESNVKRDN